MTNFWISGNVPSSKNSKRIVSKKLPNGKLLPFLIDSELAANYKKDKSFMYRQLRKDFLAEASPFISFPLHVGFYFVRDSKRDFDYHNALQIVADIMSKEGLIPDDNAREFVPVFVGTHVNREHPGVFFFVMSKEYVDSMNELACEIKKELEPEEV
jgi:hypothetical protein